MVVTGVSRGIGRACALEFAARGCGLALLGRPSTGHRETVSRCEALGVEVLSVAVDMADAAQIAAAAEQVLTWQGAPHVLVNNAGVLVRGPRVHQLTLAQWQRVMAVNVTAPFLLSRALLPAMLAQRRGRLIQMGSVSGTIACPQAAAYGSSKWALIGFTKSLAAELRGTGLSAMCLLPGSVDTDMLAQTPFPAEISVEEIANVVCYHALDAPDVMNGASIEVFG